MSIGEFGSIIGTYQIDNGITAYWPAAKVYENVYIAQIKSTGDFTTWCVDPDTGVVTAGGDMTPVGGAIYASAPFRIADGIIGYLLTDNSPSKTLIVTISINEDGSFNSILGQHNIGSFDASIPLCPLVHLSGTYYAGNAWYTDVIRYGKVWVFSIGADGLSGSVVDTLTGLTIPQDSTGISRWTTRIGDEDFLCAWSVRNGDVVVKTLNVTGGTLSLTDELTIGDDVVDGTNYEVMVEEVQPDVFLIGYHGSTYKRLKTFECAEDGTLGSILNTANDYISGDFWQIYILGTGYAIASSDNEAVSFAVAEDGTIGSIIDTFATGHAFATKMYFTNVSENMYTGYYTDNAGGGDTDAFSVEIESPPSADRIYVWLGDYDDPLQVELTDPDYSTVLAVRTERGQSELGQAETGIAEITGDNHNGDYSPENSGGQYYGDLVIGKWVSVFEIYDGTRYDHFFGRIEKITPHAEHDNQVAYILCQDGMADLARLEINTVAREDTDAGTLVDDVLDEAGWDADDRDIDSGIDTLQLGWFHKTKALDAIRTLERVEGGRFFVGPTGEAIFRNRHARLTGDGLVSQATFDETMVELAYEWSKELVYNQVTVRGRRYFLGGVMLTSGYDMAELDDELFYSVQTNDATAPKVSASGTLTLWAEVGSPIESYTALVKGTHWNANSAYDKSGSDLSDNITLTQTQYGQAIKLEFENTGTVHVYLVEPDSPPTGAPDDRTVLVYGVLYAEETVSILREDTDSQDDYGKRGLDLDIPFKSHPNDLEDWATFLLGKYKDAVPRAISCRHVARTAWDDDTIRVQCLTRDIDDRITVASSKLGIDQDYYINKVIQEYVFLQGGTVHETTWIIERCLGTSEGVFWLLGTAGFGELGETTRLGV